MNAKLIFTRAMQGFLAIAILLGGLAGAYFLILAKPSAATVPPAPPKPVLVQTETLRQGTQPALVSGYGTVQSFQQVGVQPQVDGEVIAQNDKLIAGGQFNKDEVLFHIDPRDYEYLLEQEKANLVRAEFELKLEEGNQVVAAREWKLLSSSIKTNDLGRQLALRQPHLLEKEAAVLAAKSRVEEAKLNLERTTVRAPFNAIVLDESVERGQLVGPTSVVVQLVDTDAFHVVVSIPVAELDWVQLPDINGEGGSKAIVIHDLGDGRQIQREGRVTQRLASVDSNGRLARLLVEVKDPLDLKTSPNDRHALLLGSYVQVRINGPELSDVFVIPRRSLREGDRVWVIGENGKLEFRDVSVIQGSRDSLTVRGNLKTGEDLVTSNLAAPLPGMLVAKSNGQDKAKTELAERNSTPQPQKN